MDDSSKKSGIIQEMRLMERQGILKHKSKNSHNGMESPDTGIYKEPSQYLSYGQTSEKRREESFTTPEEKTIDATKMDYIYHMIAENTSDLIALTTFSLHPKYIYLNKTNERLLGYRIDELIGRSAIEFVHPDDRKQMLSLLKKYLSSKGKKLFTGENPIPTEKFDYRVIDRHGGIHHLNCTGNIVNEGVLLISKEVTHEISVQSQLHSSEERYRNIFESSPEGILIANLKGTITSCNPSFVHLTGYDKNDIVGKNFIRLPTLIKRDIPTYLKLFNTLRHGGSASPVNFKWRHHDGSIKSGECQVSVIKENNKIKGFQVLLSDITEREKKEDELDFERKQLLSIFDSIDASIYVADPKTYELLYVNTHIQKTFNTPLIGKKCYKALQNKSAPCEFCTNDQLFDTKNKSKTYRWNFHNPIANIDYNITDRVIRWPDGRDVRFEFAVDVSEQNRLNEKLSQEKTHCQTLFNAMVDPVLILNKKGKILEVTDNIKEITGWEKDDLIGKTLLKTKLLTKKDTTLAMMNLMKQISGIDIAPYEVELLTNEGKSIPFEINTKIIDYKGQAADMLVLRNITERKKAELKIKDNEESLKHIYDSMNDGLCIHKLDYDDSGKAVNYTILDVNPKYESMLSLKKKDIIGEKATKIYKTNEAPYLDIYSEVSESGKPASFDTYYAPINKYFTISVFSPKKGYFATLFSDITERKLAEEQIKQKNIELKRLDELKSNFLNITSHELRTPITAITGHMQMLDYGMLGKVTEEQKKSVDVVLRNANRLDELINDVLDTSRLESGTMKFIPEKTSIRRIIDETAETMQSQADTKNITIKTTIETSLPDLIIDRSRIKQVFVNILNNAIKFSNEKDTIEFDAKNDGDCVLFEIKDHGRGMPEKEQEKIFQLFYQVDSGMDRKIGGTGLGLTISRGIVVSHGGNIWVESNKGGGSIFKVSLPKTPIHDIEGNFKKIDVFNIQEQETTNCHSPPESDQNHE